MNLKDYLEGSAKAILSFIQGKEQGDKYVNITIFFLDKSHISYYSVEDFYLVQHENISEVGKIDSIDCLPF